MKSFKLRYSLIPACITFGPLFMTNIGDTFDAGITSTIIALAGAFMVAAGLSMMLGIINRMFRHSFPPVAGIAGNGFVRSLRQKGASLAKAASPARAGLATASLKAVGTEEGAVGLTYVKRRLNCRDV